MATPGLEVEVLCTAKSCQFKKDNELFHTFAPHEFSKTAVKFWLIFIEKHENRLAI